MRSYIVEQVMPETLPKVAHDMYMDPMYVRKVEEMIAKDLFVLFAVRDGSQYVGRCTLWMAPPDEPELREEIPGVPQVNALEVHVLRRRRGVGTLLLNAAENEVKRRGYKMIAIGVEPDNKPARAMYEKRGYNYRTILGHDTHQFSWQETREDGTVETLHGESMLMTKRL